MKRLGILFALPLAGLTSACVEADQSTVTGATIGAVAGAVLADEDDRLEGAVVGAAVGGLAGNLLGRSAENPDQCVYEDRYGNRYVADCPS
jgi:phage tail tape-measure protein